MPTLTTAEKARIHAVSEDPENPVGEPLSSGSFSAVSSDPSVATISTDSTIFVNGQTAGDATVTVTRNADGTIATLEVTVTAGAPFSVTLGPALPK